MKRILNIKMPCRNLFGLLFLAVGIWFNISQASQPKEVVGNDELLFEISQNDLTRLSVENDRISALHFSGNSLNVTTEAKLGEVYFQPNVEEPINLFVTTKKGFVYKLLLTPVSIPSTQIILHNKNTFTSQSIVSGISNEYERKLTELILAIQKNDAIDGCRIYKINKTVTSPISGLHLKAEQKYKCKEYTGYKFKMQSSNNNQTAFTEKDFLTPQTKAVKIYQNYLITVNQD